MKQLSIAATGAAVLVLSSIGVSPAQAIQFTQVDYSGIISVDANFPVISSIEYPFQGSTVIDNLEGRLQDAGDTELTIDGPFHYISDQFQQLLASFGTSLDFFVNGSGSISQNGIELSSFNLAYDTTTDVLLVNQYDFESVRACLEGTCLITGNGAILGGSVTGFPVGSLSFNVSQTATPLGNSDSTATPPVRSTPEPSVVFGLVGLGGLLVSKRKSKPAA